MLDKVSDKIPRPSVEAMAKLIHAHLPPSCWEVKTGLHAPPAWLVAIVLIAYQSGRYDESSAETFAESLR